MKQTRRKELKTNELSLYLRQLYQSIERNSTYILAGALAIIVVLVICILIYQRRHNNEQAAWASYFELRDKDVTTEPEVLEKVQQLVGGWGNDASLGPRVLQLQGVMQTTLANSLSEPKDKERKIQLLKDAENAYQQMLDRFGQRADVAAEALMSMAGVEESLVVLGAGSKDKVRSSYQQVVERKPNAYADMASARLAELDRLLAPLEIIATRPAATSTAPAATRPAATHPASTQPATRP